MLVVQITQLTPYLKFRYRQLPLLLLHGFAAYSDPPPAAGDALVELGMVLAKFLS